MVQLSAVSTNSTALNPIDKPDMFISKLILLSNLSKAGVPKPYQIRQGIVMTDPSVLTTTPRYIPEGSFK